MAFYWNEIITAVLKSKPYNSVINFLCINGYSMFIPFEGNDYYPRAGTRSGTVTSLKAE